MSAVELAVNRFKGWGVHPVALDEAAREEPSGAVWLLAQSFARRDQNDHDALAIHEFVQDPPKGERWFCLCDPASDDCIQQNARVLRTWLRYARERMKSIERKLLVGELITDPYRVIR